MSEIFISYSREDLAFVEQLRTQLEGEDLGVWVDIEGLYAGEEFWPEVAKAIDAAFQPARVGLMIAGLEVPHVHVHVTPINSVTDLDFANADPGASDRDGIC